MLQRRLPYFDMLKGLAIFLVVMGHVLTMCIRDIDRALLFKIIGQVHMPLFFFISGYFTYKLTANGSLKIPDIKSRFIQLVIPGIIMGLLWMVYFPHSGLQSPFQMTFEGMWCTEYKNGYWFTITLFEIILLYSAFSLLLSKIKSLGCGILTTIILWAALIYADMIFENEIWWRLLSLKLVVTFFPAFMTGVFARRGGDKFINACSSPAVYTASLVGASLFVYLLIYPWDFPWVHSLVFIVAEPAMHVALAVVGIALVKSWSEKAFAGDSPAYSRRFASLWAYIGTQSLQIYLMHYFFLFPLTALQEPMRGMELDIVPTLVVSVGVASAVVAVTLIVSGIIGRSPLLARLLLGKK